MLNCVTVTGADDTVSPQDLARIAQQFPFVELGILRGSHSGGLRFPSRAWCANLAHIATSSLMRLSVHLCGERVRSFLSGGYTFDNDPDLFGRCQINTHGLPHDVNILNLRTNVRRANKHGLQVVFQYDNINEAALLACLDPHPGDNLANFNIAALYDLSHGEGVLPKTWPRPLPGVYCGYAGGLTPENVASELDKISSLTGDLPFWIDAETGLRSDDGRVFDLEKVVRFLEAARPYVRTPAGVEAAKSKPESSAGMRFTTTPPRRAGFYFAKLRGSSGVNAVEVAQVGDRLSVFTYADKALSVDDDIFLSWAGPIPLPEK